MKKHLLIVVGMIAAAPAWANVRPEPLGGVRRHAEDFSPQSDSDNQEAEGSSGQVDPATTDLELEHRDVTRWRRVAEGMGLAGLPEITDASQAGRLLAALGNMGTTGPEGIAAGEEFLRALHEAYPGRTTEQLISPVASQFLATSRGGDLENNLRSATRKRALPPQTSDVTPAEAAALSEPLPVAPPPRRIDIAPAPREVNFMPTEPPDGFAPSTIAVQSPTPTNSPASSAPPAAVPVTPPAPVAAVVPPPLPAAPASGSLPTYTQAHPGAPLMPLSGPGPIFVWNGSSYVQSGFSQGVGQPTEQPSEAVSAPVTFASPGFTRIVPQSRPRFRLFPRRFSR